ncbi:hypothetical protein P8452_65846 [Trifolium repens]|jgi:hypothetical protein|nr:hypothetical protein P8452_65842 [Trifolium repens]WJX83166.1 hypothetical protein P8452_65844 [Trifolium repens]WJX83168.1 hypothetical protein P8452_65846 [Trifolium repens]
MIGSPFVAQSTATQHINCPCKHEMSKTPSAGHPFEASKAFSIANVEGSKTAQVPNLNHLTHKIPKPNHAQHPITTKAQHVIRLSQE